MAVVTIVMGSKSDYETVLPAYEILRKLGVDAEMVLMNNCVETIRGREERA